MQYIAQKGEIPKIGETWIPVGRKIHLADLCLFDAAKVRRYIPTELSIVKITPTKTLGAIFLSSYGPESTLEYDEFIVAPATVKYKHRKGYWVTHMYVNNEKAMWGGRILGWPKETANFDWPGSLPGRATVSKDRNHICTISYSKPFGSLSFWTQFYAPSVLDDKIMCHRFRFKAGFGICRVKHIIPETSPIYEVCQSRRPLLAIGGLNMKGFQAEEAEVLGFIPDRATYTIPQLIKNLRNSGLVDGRSIDGNEYKKRITSI